MHDERENEGAAPVIVRSFGCRLNAHEGDVIARLARDAGVDDVTIVNSCAVTNEAVRQTRQAIRQARRRAPERRIIVTGCAAQIDPAAFAAMPEVDVVVGNVEKVDPAFWRTLGETSSARIVAGDILSARTTAPQLLDGYGERARAFLQVQTGCDHRCTFCIIPFGRGGSRSVPVDVVVSEARRLVEAGHKEIVLTGVDITSWGGDLEGAPRLGALVSAVLDRTPSLFRLRLSSIDPAEIDLELMERICGDDRVAPHLHLSVQSGDDMVLKRMKRRHARSDVVALCEAVRARRPDVAFGADLIVGFPTESEEMFDNTLRLVDDAGLDFLHVFAFSPKTGTPAARMPQVAGDRIRDRARRLREKADAALEGLLDRLIGTRQTVVAESGGRLRLGNFATATAPGLSVSPGGIAIVDIVARAGHALTATAATGAEKN